MLYLVLAVLATLALIIALAQINVWAAQPVVHLHLTLEEVTPFIRSWGAWLEERGRIVIRHTDTDVEVELRKRRYSTRPDALVLRVRNADANRKHFNGIRNVLDAAHVPYELKTTPKLRKARAIEVPLAAEDIYTPAAAQKLLEHVFGGTAGFRVHCDGQMRRPPDVPPVPLLPWRRDYAVGWRVGRKAARALRRSRN